jgi:signal transduction histidine kinase
MPLEKPNLDFSFEKTSRIFRRKLYSGLLLLFVGLMPLGYVAFTTIFSMNAERVKLNETYAQALTVANELRFQQAREEALALRFMLTGDLTVAKELIDARQGFLVTLDRLEVIHTSPVFHRELENIRAMKKNIIRNVTPAVEMRIRGGTINEVHRFMDQHGRQESDELSRALDLLFGEELSHFAAARNQVNAATSGFISTLSIAALVTAAGFLIIIFLLARVAYIKSLHEADRERIFQKTKLLASARQEIVETVSHDLKNPLTAVDLSLKMIQQKMGKDPLLFKEIDRYVQRSLGALQNMKQLIQDLLDQAKLESGNFELNLEGASIDKVVQGMAEILQPLAQQKSIEITVQSIGEIPDCVMDPRRMGQVVANLLGNAIKFTPSFGHIDIQTFMLKNELAVKISDTGPGMSPAQISHVFEKFWQAEETKKLGTGLGLSIAKAIIDAHQGRFLIESELGQGTHFTFLIPTHLHTKALPNTETCSDSKNQLADSASH